MADFSQNDYLNELARLFRGRLDPTRERGGPDPVTTHAQIMELARTVFLMNPGAIFYLARIVRNSLNTILIQEIAVVEDMLAALDDLHRPPGIIGNISPTDLSDASTALLALDAVGTVSERPELARFQRIIDNFTGALRPNITDGNGNFKLPRGEARAVISENFITLKELHPSLLEVSKNLEGLITNYLDLDIPTLVSQTALLNARTSLLEIKEMIEQLSDDDNIANSRLYYIRAVASKVIVALLEQFNVQLLGPVVTSDGTGQITNVVGMPLGNLGAGGPFLAQASGEGTAAYAVSGPGPWLLDDLDSGELQFKIDDRDAHTVDLSVIQGPGLHGKNSAPFSPDQLNPLPTWNVPPAGPNDPPPPPIEDYYPKNNVHVVVDSNTYKLKSWEWGTVLNTDPDVFYKVTDTSPDGETFEAGKLNLISRSRLYYQPRSLEDPPDPPVWYNDFYNTVQAKPPVKLGFKHLGAVVFFNLPQASSSERADPPERFTADTGLGGWNVDGQNTAEDADELEDLTERRFTLVFKPRIIVELAWLKSLTIAYAGDRTFSVVGGGTVEDHWVGFYVKTGSGKRYEITEVFSSTRFRLDVRENAEGDAKGSYTDAAGTVEVFGSRGDYTQFTFAPDLLADTNKFADTVTEAGILEHELEGHGPRGPFNIPDTTEITISPTVKTATIPSGSGGTIEQVIAALSNPVNGVQYSDPPGTYWNEYAHAAYHCIFKEQNGYNDKLTIQGRSRLLPEELKITDSFYLAVGNLKTSIGDDDDFLQYPGGYAIKDFGYSAHEVLGFESTQKVDENLDPFLSVEELQSVVQGYIDDNSVEAETEIVETDVFTGTLTTNPDREHLSDVVYEDSGDPSTSFLNLGFGYHLEIKEGASAGVYIITGVPDVRRLRVQVKSPGFVGTETKVPYRIFMKQLVLRSKNTGLGSSVEIVSSPDQLEYPEGVVQYGVVPSVSAVNSAGEVLSLQNLSEGDYAEGIGTVASVSEDGSQADIEGGVPTSILGLRFTFDGATEQAFSTMASRLQTIRTSRQLLKKHGFDTDLDALESAVTPLLTPGQTFRSQTNTAASLLADLFAVLTSTARRDDYTTAIPNKDYHIEDTIVGYTAPRVAALDALLDSLNEHQFDRALTLLVTGDLDGFFNTTHETASSSGAMLASLKNVAADFPTQPLVAELVDEELNTATGVIVGTDADTDFSDTVGEDVAPYD